MDNPTWNTTPSPLSHDSVTGDAAVSSGADAVHTSSGPGTFTAPSAVQPYWM